MEPIDEAELARLRDLPWIAALDAGDAAQLVAEYEGGLRESYRTGDRSGLDAILEVWEARARQRSEVEVQVVGDVQGIPSPLAEAQGRL